VQVTGVELLEQIRSAFGRVACPSREAMLLERYRNSIDACEMADAFAGRLWSEITRRDLFLHREMMIAMTAAAYQACLAAYLAASLAPTDDYSGDLSTYLVLGLSHDASEVQERLSLVDDDQRRATMNVLDYLFEHRNMRQAKIVFDAWRGTRRGA
jgi:hypothetical protein